MSRYIIIDCLLKGYGEKSVAIRINNINLSLDDDLNVLEKKICKKLNISKEDISRLDIIKRSIDARKKNDIKVSFSVNVFCKKRENVTIKNT